MDGVRVGAAEQHRRLLHRRRRDRLAVPRRRYPGSWCQVEAALGDGPYFGGASFSLVDAVFGPVFRYFDVFDAIGDFWFLDRAAAGAGLACRAAKPPSVVAAVQPGLPERLRACGRAARRCLSGCWRPRHCVDEAGLKFPSAAVLTATLSAAATRQTQRPTANKFQDAGSGTGA